MKNLISTKVLTVLLIVIVAFLALSKLSLQGKRKKHFVKITRKNKNNVFNGYTNYYISGNSAKFFPYERLF